MEASELAEILSAKTKPGFLDPALKKRADDLFFNQNFVLVCLHGHLLVEKALNHMLLGKGTPEILLREDGLTFHQKYEAYVSLFGLSKFDRQLFKAINRLRNNVAHEFWADDAECLRSAFKYAFQAKSEKPTIDELAAKPLESARWVFVGILNRMGALDTAVR